MSVAESSSRLRSASPTWLPGLDLVRASAIVLVVWAHGRALLPRGGALDVPWLAPAHWGIELFFALSGYLIIGELEAALVAGSWRALRVFCIKRFLRTIPVYWLVLALLSLAVPGEIRVQMWLQEALFLRTFPFAGTHGATLLAVNWSLAVEEMSYLLLAAASALLLWSRPNWRSWLLSERAALAVLLLVLIGVGFLARLWAVRQGFGLDQLKFSALLHVDALAYGGLARLWANQRRLQARQPLPNPWLLAAALLPLTAWFGLVVRAPYLLPDPSSADLLTHTVFAYGNSRLVAAGLVLAMAAVPVGSLTQSKAWMALIGTTAAASYSTYLLHQVLVLQWVSRLRSPASSLSPALFWQYLLASLALGYLSYQVLEKPWIRLRRRLS